jgi:hypothetical protein
MTDPDHFYDALEPYVPGAHRIRARRERAGWLWVLLALFAGVALGAGLVAAFRSADGGTPTPAPSVTVVISDGATKIISGGTGAPRQPAALPGPATITPAGTGQVNNPSGATTVPTVPIVPTVSTAETAVQTAQTATATHAVTKTKIGPGFYVVGQDIQTGNWVATHGNSACSWTLILTAGTIDLGHGSGSAPIYVTVTTADKDLQVDGPCSYQRTGS